MCVFVCVCVWDVHVLCAFVRCGRCRWYSIVIVFITVNEYTMKFLWNGPVLCIYDMNLSNCQCIDNEHSWFTCTIICAHLCYIFLQVHDTYNTAQYLNWIC